MSLDAINKKIVSTKKMYAEAKALQVTAEHNRTIVLSAVKNKLEVSSAADGGKAASDTKLERLAKDTAEYRNAVDVIVQATKAAIEL